MVKTGIRVAQAGWARLLLPVGVGVLVAFALLLPSAGQAASIYQHTGSFGGACGDPGQPACPADGLFRKDPLPQRIVVHQESGKLFVADPGDNRVQVFERTADGASFAYSIPTPAPQAVAIDPVTSDLYVVNRAVSPNPGRVTKFNPDNASDPASFTPDATFTTPVQGPGIGQVGGFSEGVAPSFPPTTITSQTLRGGIAVDPGTRDILIVDTARNQVHRFTSDGTYVSSFNGADADSTRVAFRRLMDLAVLANGDVITADFLNVAGTTWRPRCGTGAAGSIASRRDRAARRRRRPRPPARRPAAG